MGRTYVFSRNSVRYMSMNLAAPPFDDVHVRRAANYITDKQAFIKAYGGPLAGTAPTHVVLDSLEDGQLVGYDPFRSSSPADALAKAKDEMRLSKYDRKHDGVCDAKVCQSILALAFPRQVPAAMDAIRSVAKDLSLIGLKLRITPVDGQTFFTEISKPELRIPVGLSPAWSQDFLNASNFMTPLFGSPGVGTPFTVPGSDPGTCCNFSLVGASPAALRHWGYADSSVPSVDNRIQQCLRLIGRPQLDCWTALDQYLTQVVVPWVPLILENQIAVVPARVVNISFDQFTTLASLDQVVVRSPASPAPS